MEKLAKMCRIRHNLPTNEIILGNKPDVKQANVVRTHFQYQLEQKNTPLPFLRHLQPMNELHHGSDLLSINNHEDLL